MFFNSRPLLTVFIIPQIGAVVKGVSKLFLLFILEWFSVYTIDPTRRGWLGKPAHFPLNTYYYSRNFQNYKMAKCTKKKGERRGVLCILPSARVFSKTYFFIFFYKYYNIFFKKNQVCDPGGAPVKSLTGA